MRFLFFFRTQSKLLVRRTPEQGDLNAMKGKPEVLEVLSEMLMEELGAINQYILHAEMCENWGYKRLGGGTKKQSIGEMKHAAEHERAGAHQNR